MDETASRAARLEALKQAKRLLEDERREDGDKPVLRFRNYELRDETIEHVKVTDHLTSPLPSIVDKLSRSFPRRGRLSSTNRPSIPLTQQQTH